MADEVKGKIDEEGGQSTWSNYATKGPYFYPRGALGRWFSKFFATPAQDAVVRRITDVESPQLTGDTKLQSSDPQDQTGAGAFTINRTTPVYSEIERSRRERYKDYESMDEYPEVGSAFDMYAQKMVN